MQFGDEDAFREMLDYNALAHETIFNTLLGAGTIISHYPLFTFGGDDEDWRLVHAQVHGAIAAALDIGTVQLDDVDFKDPEQYEAWISDHASHHSQIAAALGI